MKPFQIITSTDIIKHRYCNVQRQKIRLPSGHTQDWFVHTSADAVVVIPRLADGQILLQYTYKHGIGREIIEFCAGMIDEGEFPLQTAKRELLEETGYQAGQFINLGSSAANPTSSNMSYHFFLAEQAYLHQAPSPTEDEQIVLKLVPDIQAASQILLHSPTIASNASIAALSFLQIHEQKIKDDNEKIQNKTNYSELAHDNQKK